MIRTDKKTDSPKFIYLSLALFLLYSLFLIRLAKPISFLSDDWGLINFNSFSFSNLFTTDWHGLARVGGSYRPLIRLSFYLNYLISGPQPAFFHITNVIFHIINSFLVFFLFREIISKKNFWGPLLAAYLFFVLPIHTDSIFWIAGRTDTICAIFFFLTVIYYSKYLSSPSLTFFIISGLCFWAALLSKEMSLSLPGLFIILAVYKQKFFERKTWYLLLFILISYMAYFFIRLHALGAWLDNPANTNISLKRIFTSIIMACRLIFTTNKYQIGIGLSWLTAFFILWSLPKPNLRRDLLFLGCLFLVSLVPVIGLMMQWYLYIPSAFACLILTRVGLECFQNKQVKRMILALFIGLLFYYKIALVREGFIWREASKISERTLESVLAYLKQEKGKVFLVNVPSAYETAWAMGGKPIFAYDLNSALAIKSDESLGAIPIVINHLWLFGSESGISSIKRIDPLHFMVECNQKGAFTFHSPEFVSERVKPLNTAVNLPWGQLNIVNQHRIIFKINSYQGEKILFYDGSLWSRW